MNAELLVRERSEVMSEWIERHRSYERILRGAALASALLLISMAAARLGAQRTPPRYRAAHFVGGAVLFAVFLLAYLSQDRLIRERVSSYLIETTRVETVRASSRE